MSVQFTSFSVKGKYANFPVILSKVNSSEVEDHSAAAEAVASLSGPVKEGGGEAVAPLLVPAETVYEVLVLFNKACKSFSGSINRDQGKNIHNYYTAELDAWLKTNGLVDIRSSKRLRIYSFIDFCVMFRDKEEILADMASKIHAYISAHDIVIADEDYMCIDRFTGQHSSPPPKQQLQEEEEEEEDSGSPPPAPKKKRAYRRRVKDDKDEVLPKKVSRRSRSPDNDDDEPEAAPRKLPRKRDIFKDDNVPARLARIEEMLGHIDPSVIRDSYIKENEKALKDAYFMANAEKLNAEYFSALNKQLASFVEERKMQ
jgi:hypothetical protein